MKIWNKKVEAEVEAQEFQQLVENECVAWQVSLQQSIGTTNLIY